MANKRHKPDEIVTKLWQVEVLRGQGLSMAEAVRQVGISELTFYRWRKQYGGMSRDELRQLKELQKETIKMDPSQGADQTKVAKNSVDDKFFYRSQSPRSHNLS